MKRIVFMMMIVGMFLALFTSMTSAKKSKILFVDSYHAEYEWSDGITKGILNALNMRLAEKLGVRFPLTLVKHATLIK